MTTAPASPAPAVREAEEEARVEAGCYATAADGFDHGLVALAMGCPYWLEEGEGSYRLLVPAAAAERVREQLEIFDRENLGWPPPRLREAAAPGGRFSAALFLSALWALAALAVFVAQGKWPGVTEAGAMDARAVFSGGEWWRAATALFLHADLGHVSSNVGGGVFLFSAVLMTFGRARGSVLIAVAAVAANLAVGAAYYPSEYRSLGASTALFAALGLLSGRAVRMMLAGSVGSWRRAWVPLGAGATMLMLFGAGAGEAHVDVPAHAAGFLAGLVAGSAAACCRF